MFRLCRRLCAGGANVMTPRTALKILKLAPSTDLSQTAIKKAYVTQTLLCHPDLFPNDPHATDKFRTLSDALRVALKALEVRQGLAGAPSGAASDGQQHDSQAALEALRRAILVYREHREGARSDSAGAATRGASAGTGDGPPPPSEDVAFFSPSLEYVSAVCQREALAMRRVQVFCRELPAVLCGSSSAALFEAVAFFHSRYVESTSECVLRFSKNLPVIVRRVVRNRRRYIRNRQTKLTTGIATGRRPREQRIEDMAMKPLVLVGALVFDLPLDADAATGARTRKDEEEDGSVASTCGVSRRRDLAVCEELVCTIYPSDSITNITEKLGAWESASYERLKLELAMVDVCVFLSGMLGLAPPPEEAGGDANDDHSLAVTPHLHVGHAVTARVLHTLQHLATALCEVFDESLDGSQRARVGATPTTTGVTPVAEKMDGLLAALAAGAAGSRAQRCAAYAELDARAAADDTDARETLPLPVLLAECRALAEMAAPGLRGSVAVTWREEADLLRSPAEAAAAAPPPPDADPTRGYRVGRHADCCTAEMIAFAVSLELCADLRVFLLRLRSALRTVVVEHAKAHQLLPQLLQVRDATVKEEFMPEAGREGGGEEDQRYRYRAPIFNFARTHNMVTSRELAFWQHLHAHREYVAQHSAAAGVMNVYLDCVPGAHPSSGTAVDPEELRAASGWIGESADDGGASDNVVLTSAELETEPSSSSSSSSSPFRQWLEDVVEQSSLNKECRTLLDEAGIGYVQREPTLPLANYLSFLKVFVAATAVRGVLERAADRGAGEGRPRVVRTADIGIAIVVGHRCDVRDGGRLLVPWSLDPNILLALLADGGGAAPMIGDGAA